MDERPRSRAVSLKVVMAADGPAQRQAADIDPFAEVEV
jgi:hypothetical protein